ncbi:MAG: helix-turn-helix transcriptional regulator [Cyanobacteria bacterium P01_G01_bin.39]
MTNTSHIEFEESSGNVFADLGVPDAEEHLVRAQLGFYVVTLLKNRNLKQKDAAKLLEIAQPDVSHLMNGHFSRFTTDKLLNFLKRLEQKVTIEISPHHVGEPYQNVVVLSHAIVKKLQQFRRKILI